MKSAPIALIYTNADGEIVPADAAVLRPGDFAEKYQELPIPYGRFHPALTRRLVPPSEFKVGITWLYAPPFDEREAVQLPDAPPWLDGLVLPAQALFLPKVPRWVRLGLAYARAFYEPLFRYDETASAGLISLVKTHPGSFEAIARASRINSQVRKDYLLARLMALWDLLTARGFHITEEKKVGQYAEVAGADISTVRGYNRVKQLICRGNRNPKLRDAGDI